MFIILYRHNSMPHSTINHTPELIVFLKYSKQYRATIKYRWSTRENKVKSFCKLHSITRLYLPLLPAYFVGFNNTFRHAVIKHKRLLRFRRVGNLILRLKYSNTMVLLWEYRVQIDFSFKNPEFLIHLLIYSNS